MSKQHAQAGTEEARIGELVGDRPCAKCHFNLAGQTIVRERHYGMLMVRCPECGTPAALQEYPMLGRWAARMGYVLAGLWLAVVLGLAAASALVIWRMSEVMARQMAGPFTVYVQRIWADHQAALGPPNPYAYANPQENQAWWNGLDKKQLFADAGGWGGAVAWSTLWYAFDMLLVVGAMGAVMAVVMPHARGWRRMLLVALVGGLAGSFLWMSATMSPFRYPYYSGSWAADRDLMPVLMPLAVGIGLGCFLVGLCVGRTLMRVLVVLLLPPRLRAPLAFLWRADGKPPPRASAS